MSKYETYNGLVDIELNCFEDLQGLILSKVVVDDEVEEIRFYLTDTHYAALHHNQDCCEHVYIESIVGDLNDLIETPLLLVEESISTPAEEDSYESATWTFYRFRTIKGSVDIRWVGESNGYYSESVDFRVVKGETEDV